MAYSVAVKNVTKRMKENLALDSLSIHFQEAKMHGVIGPEGAGKTTLLRMLAGLLRPNSGEITYSLSEMGKIVNEVTFSVVKNDLAYMPQLPSLYPDLSVSEHLDFFSEIYQLDKKLYEHKRNELLKITRLDKFVDRSAGKLSGGMYKKLGLMCVLLRSPKIILLDEPTNGVDPISRREFWEMLYKLLKENILIIISTAYMDEAERCEMAHLLQSGKLLVSGEPRKLLLEYKTKNICELFIKQTATS
ncbi:MAG: ABC transporter ATP-binding protein [Oligoflexia bacterium]|nr:ABC transporter ATP-binding protein [Oligoflexia bacterium]